MAEGMYKAEQIAPGTYRIDEYVHQSDTAPIYKLLSSRFAASLLLPKGTKLPRQPMKPKAIPMKK